MTSGLHHCNPHVSYVIKENIEEVWKVVRNWGQQDWFNQVDGLAVGFNLLEGSGCSIGSLRLWRLGSAQLFERLVALDDLEHVTKWRLVSHPESISPFPEASFYNSLCTLTLKEVTEGNHTFISWTGFHAGEFLTDHEHSAELLSTVTRWYQTGLLQLEAYVRHQNVRNSSTTQNRQLRPGQASSHDWKQTTHLPDLQVSQHVGEAFQGLSMGNETLPIPSQTQLQTSGRAAPTAEVPDLQSWAAFLDAEALSKRNRSL